LTWDDVIPHHIASKQKAWERRCSILRAVDDGASQADISRSIGISQYRVHCLVQMARRDKKFNVAPPVIEWWSNSDEFMVCKLSKKRLARLMLSVESDPA